jgi:hypothetical protein
VLSAPGAERPEPRWPVVLAIFAAVALHFVLPRPMRVGPPWLLAGTVLALVAVAWTGRRFGRNDLNELAGYSIVILLTIGMLYALGSLLVALVHHAEQAPALLRSGASLWATNVLVFATWYWRLDAGGPNERERRTAHTSGAFLFPQMTMLVPRSESAAALQWRPGFVDYLFVAFNTSTAFSPTDVPVLSRWAKLAMMVQAIISFTAVVLVAARAVNIL